MIQHLAHRQKDPGTPMTGLILRRPSLMTGNSCVSSGISLLDVSLLLIDRRHPAAHFDLAFRPSSSGQTRGRRGNGRRDMAMAVVTSGLTGLRDGGAMTGIPYIAPVASLLLLLIDIRGVSVQLPRQESFISRLR
jgi:hypothetical protein